MVDASLSISVSRLRAAAPRLAPSAVAFDAALPDTAPPVAAPPVAASSGAATPVTDLQGAAPPVAVPLVVATPKAATPSAFHVLLSELNPLQYVPVVGTIYRAVTGDTIPEAARVAGGLVVSGLTGGPIGIAMNVGATLIEHLVGIDPEKLGDRLLSELGIGHASPAHAALAAAAPAPATPASATAVPATSPAPVGAVAAPTAVPSARAWSPAQLAAYGVTGGADATLRRGTLSGADVLNSLELARIAAPAQA